MAYPRLIKSVSRSKRTIEGAGVRLKRAFGFAEVPLFDPFLMLDDFHSDKPDDYIAGFPWHPHRGIETVTYMISGEVEHGDSMGNKGIIRSGEVQWMTAGSGIIHQEMPQKQKGTLWGLQLWVNLPASHKMMNPRYRDIRSLDIPELKTESGAVVKIIAGRVNGIQGPVKDIILDPEYLDVTVPAGSRFDHPIERSHSVFAYVLAGRGFFDRRKKEELSAEQLILFQEGDEISATAGEEEFHFILVSGPPINEPVAWSGPIVMNTQEELALAFEEYKKGRFIKFNRPSGAGPRA